MPGSTSQAVTKRDFDGWLEAVLLDAQRAGWCMQPYCTTCGCLEFRRAYWAAAAERAGIADRFESARIPKDLLGEISAAEREVLVRALVAGLRELPRKWSDSEAFRTIIIDLDPPLILHGVLMSLDAELSATPAGEALTQMRSHSKEARERRERRTIFESPQATEDRKRAEREDKAAAHTRRQSEAVRRNTERSELLADLARLAPVERLSRFSTDSAFKLDCVSPELIPVLEGELIGLEKALAVALVKRIGRRSGAWGRLRRMLEQFVLHEK
jgi:hypothetical protein